MSMGRSKLLREPDLQIGTTNTNVDDGCELLACIPGPRATADLFREFLHVVQDLVGLLDDTLAVNGHGLVAGIPESHMIDGSLLSEVDLLTSKHFISEFLELRLF